MLDTNAFDEIYDNRLGDELKLAVDAGRIRFFMTHIQQDEIAKMRDSNKRTYSQNAITSIPVEIIASSAGVFGTNKRTKHGFEGSRVGGFRFSGDTELLDSLKSTNSKNPMGKDADLLIAYTAVKENMNYLVTENVGNFAQVVHQMNRKLGGNTTVIGLQSLAQMV